MRFAEREAERLPPGQVLSEQATQVRGCETCRCQGRQHCRSVSERRCLIMIKIFAGLDEGYPLPFDSETTISHTTGWPSGTSDRLLNLNRVPAAIPVS